MIRQFIQILFFINFISAIPVLSAQLQMNTQTAKNGDTVLFTVFIHDAPDPVDAFGFEIAYDATVMTYQSNSANRGALISKGFSFFQANNVNLGRIRIGGLETGDQKIALGTSGTLFSIQFNVIGEKNSELLLENLKDDFKSWTTQNGQLIILTDETETEQTDQNNSQLEKTEPDDQNSLSSQTDNNSDEIQSDDQSVLYNQTKSKINNSETNVIEHFVATTNTPDNIYIHDEQRAANAVKSGDQRNQRELTSYNPDSASKATDLKNEKLHINTKTPVYQQKKNVHQKTVKKQMPVVKQSHANQTNDDTLQKYDWGQFQTVRRSGSNVPKNAPVYNQQHFYNSPNMQIFLSFFSLIVQMGILGMLILIYRKMCKNQQVLKMERREWRGGENDC